MGLKDPSDPGVAAESTAAALRDPLFAALCSHAARRTEDVDANVVCHVMH